MSEQTNGHDELRSGTDHLLPADATGRARLTPGTARGPRTRTAPPAAALALLGCVLLIAIGCLPIPGLRPQEIPYSTITPTWTSMLDPTRWPATWTPTVTRTSTSAPAARPTFTPYGTPPAGGPWSPGKPGTAGGGLSVEYRIDQVSCTSDSSYTADFTIWGSGGDGKYIYYRDIDRIGGPTSNPITYRLLWKDCGGAPGTFFVESAGKRASKLFWVWPPLCCTVRPATP